MLYFEFEEGKKGIEKSQERRIGVRSKEERLGKRAATTPKQHRRLR
jgi:hypothetical protein